MTSSSNAVRAARMTVIGAKFLTISILIVRA
jgi:hypothetical protein